MAWRYRNRIKVYQIWNEPNIYPEWGLNPINATDYVALLREAYTRIKAVDPDAIVVMGALAATIELDRVRTEGVSPGGLSDVLFLQQVYDAGGGAYFDVLAMQGYGLFSGPYDRRMQPRVLNFSRPQYIRDVMVRNGDSHKPIWLSEMGWNAVPLELGIPPIYGHVSPEQQGRYGALAYQRIQEEWPWLGVGFYWFLKQASDEELKNGDPQYFFRLLEPDFTPMPAYTMLQDELTQPPVMHKGFHQEDHWATRYSDNWQVGQSDKAVFGKVLESGSAGATMQVTFYGSRLQLVTLPHPNGGEIQVQVNNDAPKVITLSSRGSSQVTLVGAVQKDHYDVTLTVTGETPVRIDGFIVQSYPTRLLSYVGSFTMLFALIFGVWAVRRQKDG